MPRVSLYSRSICGPRVSYCLLLSHERSSCARTSTARNWWSSSRRRAECAGWTGCVRVNRSGGRLGVFGSMRASLPPVRGADRIIGLGVGLSEPFRPTVGGNLGVARHHDDSYERSPPINTGRIAWQPQAHKTWSAGRCVAWRTELSERLESLEPALQSFGIRIVLAS